MKIEILSTFCTIERIQTNVDRFKDTKTQTLFSPDREELHWELYTTGQDPFFLDAVILKASWGHYTITVLNMT